MELEGKEEEEEVEEEEEEEEEASVESGVGRMRRRDVPRPALMGLDEGREGSGSFWGPAQARGREASWVCGPEPSLCPPPFLCPTSSSPPPSSSPARNNGGGAGAGGG
jgi:hypothetical protein